MSVHWGRFKLILRKPVRFFLQVLSGFRANQGFLLSGAVAYYMLLSIVPMFALILVILSQLVDKPTLLESMNTYVGLLVPGQSAALTAQVEVFIDNWKLVGGVGLLILLFFSSLAFTVLENAMSIIFFHRVAIRRRHFLVSAILPYLFIIALALGLLVVSTISGLLHGVEDSTLKLFGVDLPLGGAAANVLYLLGVAGEVLLLTSLYLVMPVGRIAFRHALVGGVTAAVLWELTRHVLIWYFATLSIVNIVYGSFATAIIILLSFEAAALILLFGAQVIAEYERTGPDERPGPGMQF